MPRSSGGMNASLSHPPSSIFATETSYTEKQIEMGTWIYMPICELVISLIYSYFVYLLILFRQIRGGGTPRADQVAFDKCCRSSREDCTR